MSGRAAGGDFEDLVRIVRTTVATHVTTILLVGASAALAATVVSFFVPEKYAASALVLIRPQEYPGVKPAEPSSKEVLNLPATGSTIQVDTPSRTYIEVMKSRSVAEHVVQALDLGAKERLAPDAPLLARLRYWAKRAVFAAKDIAKYGRIVDASPEQRAVIRLMENTTLSAVKDSFVFEISYVSGDPQEAAAVTNATAAAFVEYSSALNQSDAKSYREYVDHQVADAERTLANARSALQAFQQSNHTVSLKEERSERIKSIAALRIDLDKADAELAGLLANYTTSSPQVKLMRGKRGSLERAIAAQEKALIEIPDKERQLAALELDVKTFQSTYEYLKAQLEEARLRESSKLAEIRIVSPAGVPAYPIRPIKIYYAGIALALGLLGGLGWALWVEVTDARLRAAADVERALDLPLLATLPKL